MADHLPFLRQAEPGADGGDREADLRGVRRGVPWIVEATDASFNDTVATTVPVLVDLWAPWCGPCRMVTPILEDLACQRAGHLKVVKVNPRPQGEPSCEEPSLLLLP